jgi:hypothetical protein
MVDAPPRSPASTVLRPPAEPPPSRGDIRAVLAAQYLAGDGIEIGALHSALPLPEGARAKYVDRLPVSELRRQYPELAQLDLVDVDIIDDGETLSRIPDGSQDFIVASQSWSTATTRSGRSAGIWTSWPRAAFCSTSCLTSVSRST